eukprot:3218031-Prymnesium_polylepis.1
MAGDSGASVVKLGSGEVGRSLPYLSLDERQLLFAADSHVHSWPDAPPLTSVATLKLSEMEHA